MRAIRRKQAWADAPERPFSEAPRADASEAQDIVDSFLARLSEPQRCAFVLCELQGFTAKEASAALGTNPNTVAARLRSARKSFSAFADEVRADGEPVLRSDRAAAPPDDAERRVWVVLGASMAALPAKSLSLVGMISAAMFAGLLAGVSLGAIAGRPSAASGEPDGPRRSADPVARPEPAVGSVTPDVSPERTTNTAATAPERKATASARDLSVAPERPIRSEQDTGTSAVATHSTSSSAMEERSLLSLAQRAAVDRSWGDVQHHVDRYRARFPQGMFLDEITLLELRAQCGKGDVHASRTMAAAWAEAHPSAPLAAVARSVCAP